jgi:outer membrane protein
MNERIVRYEERMLEAARGRRALTERKLPHLGSGPLDLLRADLAVSEQRQLVERAQGQVAKGKLELSLRMGVRDTAFSLVEEVPQVFDPRIFDADQLVELAISANPRIEQLAAAERAAQHRINAGNGARWPTLSFSTGLTRGFHRSGYGALFTVDPPNVSVSFGLSTSFTVFDQFRSANNRQSIRIAHTNTQLHLQSGRMETEKAVRIALMDLRTAYDEFQIAQASSRLAVLANTSANEQYQRGILRFEDVQDVVIQTTRAERAVDLARLAFIRALLTLEEVVGAPLSNVST